MIRDLAGEANTDFLFTPGKRGVGSGRNSVLNKLIPDLAGRGRKLKSFIGKLVPRANATANDTETAHTILPQLPQLWELLLLSPCSSGGSLIKLFLMKTWELSFGFETLQGCISFFQTLFRNFPLHPPSGVPQPRKASKASTSSPRAGRPGQSLEVYWGRAGR